MIDRADAPRFVALLKPGQRLVSRDGDLWRWDGFSVAANAPTGAARRLAGKNRLADIEAEAGIGAAPRSTPSARRSKPPKPTCAPLPKPRPRRAPSGARRSTRPPRRASSTPMPNARPAATPPAHPRSPKRRAGSPPAATKPAPPRRIRTGPRLARAGRRHRDPARRRARRDRNPPRASRRGARRGAGVCARGRARGAPPGADRHRARGLDRAQGELPRRSLRPSRQRVEEATAERASLNDAPGRLRREAHRADQRDRDRRSRAPRRRRPAGGSRECARGRRQGCACRARSRRHRA